MKSFDDFRRTLSPEKIGEIYKTVYKDDKIPVSVPETTLLILSFLEEYHEFLKK